MSDQRRTELNDNGTDPHMIQAPAPVVTAPFGPLVGSSNPNRGIDMKTARTVPFYREILSVNAGVELEEAIEEAGNIVNAALDTLKGVACGLSIEDGGKDAWTAIYALEIADGLLHAVAAGLVDLDRTDETTEGAK